MFWQLVSVCRANPSALERLLEEPEWADFLKWFKNFRQHVNSQNRAILDAVLPEQLVVSAMRLSEYRFRIQLGVLYQCLEESEGSISAVEAYNRYGGEAIEQVLEKGSFQLPSPT